MSTLSKIRLAEKLSSFSDHWNPRIIASYNNNEVRLAKIEGDFTWHSHQETDEMFLVISGEMGLEFRDGTVFLETGDMIVVPKGTEHRPFAEKECHIMLLDYEGESNTGVNPSTRTRATLQSI